MRVCRLSSSFTYLADEMTEILRVAQRALRIADGTAISQIQSTLRDSHDWVEYYHATQDAAGTLGIVLKATDVEIKDDELSRVSQVSLHALDVFPLNGWADTSQTSGIGR